MLTCTICGKPANFAKVRLEIAQGAATYLLCGKPVCIRETIARAEDNLLRASGRQREMAAGEQERAKARKVIIAPSKPLDS